MAYSYKTSLPAYRKGGEKRFKIRGQILSFIKKRKHTCLLQISEQLGIEQGRVSARMDDLIKLRLAKYDGYCYYPLKKNECRKRKKIIAL